MNKISLGLYKGLPWLYTRTSFIAKIPEGTKLLDLGCGPMPLYMYYKKFIKDIKLFGADISQSKEFPLNVNFVRININKGIEFDDNSFDVIVCSHVIEHLENVSFAFQEISRVLKPGGRIYVEAPSHRSILFPSFGFVNKKESVPINFYDDPTHIRPYSPIALEQLCRQCGLVVRKSGYARNWLAVFSSILFFPLAIILRKRSFLVNSLWHIFGWSSFVEAYKVKND